MNERIGAGLGTGAYVGGSTALLVALLTAVAVAPAFEAAILAGAAVGVVLGLAARRRYRRVEAIARRRVAAGLLSIPGVAAAALVAVSIPFDGRRAFAAVAGAALVAVLGWLLLRRTARTVRARRLVGDAPALASLPGPTDRTPSPRLRRLNAVFAVVLAIWAVLAFLEGGEQWWFPLLLLLSPLSVFLDPLSGVTLTDAGVLVERRFGARLYEWESFEGFYLADDRLVLLRPAWWRDDLSFDREAVSDDAVAIVAERLPRAPAPVVPVGGFRRPLGDGAEPAVDR